MPSFFSEETLVVSKIFSELLQEAAKFSQENKTRSLLGAQCTSMIIRFLSKDVLKMH